MKKLRLSFLAMIAVALSCQIMTAHGWHQHFKSHGCHHETTDSVIDSTYHHKSHHHNDSIDYDSLYQDSVFIYHHGHKHFKNDSIPYDSLRHDTVALDSQKVKKPNCHNWAKNWFDKWNNYWNNYWTKNWDKKHKDQTPDTFYVNNILYVDSMTVAPGTQSVVLPIVLDNKDVVRSFSFRVSLPDGITLAKDSLGKVEISADTTRLNADLYIQKTHNGDFVFQFWKDRKNTISGNSGTIAYLTVNLADTLTAGDYTIELTGVQMTDAYNQKHRGYTSCTALTIASAAAKARGNVEVSAIQEVKVTPATSSSAYYDLNGRKVAAPKSGNVYIHNGKKVIK